MPITLDTSVTELHKVGKSVEKQLLHLGIHTVLDLLLYYPFRHEDFSAIVPIKDLKEGEQVTVKGQIEVIGSKRSPRRRTIITEAIVRDETGRLRVVWFGQPFIAKVLRIGDTIFLSGRATKDMFGLSMVRPAYERAKVTPIDSSPRRGGVGGVAIGSVGLSQPNNPPYVPPTRGESELNRPQTTHTARIVPIYSITKGVTQKQLRFLASQVIDLAKQIPDWLPAEFREAASIVPFAMAVRYLHFPDSTAQLRVGRHRMKFDELFILQLRAEMTRQAAKRFMAPSIPFRETETRAFVRNLPFRLTDDQRVAAWEIIKDMSKNEPMNRLLEGDVGAGKTIVAGIAMYNAVLNGYQTALLAPTEILALQHYDSLKKLFSEELGLALITGNQAELSQKSKVKSQKSLANRRESIQDVVASGQIDIVVGTHALLSENIQFTKLGLVVVDEQHRFGVEQRAVIREKSGMRGMNPHFLSMTATPIPRTLALALYGDLDISIIRQMPAGRKPIKTRLVDAHNRGKAHEFIREQVKQGRQCFVICPLITTEDEEVSSFQFPVSQGMQEETRNLKLETGDEKKSVLSEYKKLSEEVFSDLRVGYLHGKQKPAERDKTMKKFAEGELDILVSTSVVEVGVNIPNASVMMIEGAERFGLAQLHQFRGRVGRADHQSYCFLFMGSETETARERLAFFEKNTDGFALAEYDLKDRGPGEVYGKEQSGGMRLRFASLRDTDLIRQTRDLAHGIDFDKYPGLKERVKEWERRVHLE